IELDGSFSGDTPSAITVAPGEHTIRISKARYKSWERKMKTTSGNIKIVADLEQSQSDTTQRVAPEVPNTPKPAPAIAPTQPAPVAPTQPASSPSVQQATVEFWSSPAGADIEVDGKYIGSTPSTITVQAGEHTITMRKQDFGAWQK